MPSVDTTLLQQILSALAAAVLQITGINGVLQAVATATGVTGTEPDNAKLLQVIQAEGSAIFLESTGLDAIYAAIAANHTAEMAALAAVQLAANPVILPTVPPSGYGGSTGATAAEVWAYPSPTTGHAAIDSLDNAGFLSLNLATMEAVFPLGGNPNFGVRGTWWSDFGVNSPGSTPSFNYGAILLTDSLGAFLERESGYTGWAFDGAGYWSVSQGGASPFHYVCLVSQERFYEIQQWLFGLTVSVGGAPLWPGLANVTLGTPVTLDVGLSITTPMDGVIVAITSAPIKQGYFTFDTVRSWRNVGALSFFDDNGQQEYAQTLAFETAVYCPKSMLQASGVRIRTSNDVVGTVTPWTKTV